MTPQQLIYATNVLIETQIEMQIKLQTLTTSIYLLSGVVFIVIGILYISNKKKK